MSLRFTLPATWLNMTPTHSSVIPLMVMLPPTVLFFTDQGISSLPPPVNVTLRPTVTPFSRTTCASVPVTFPLTVMTEWPSGSTVQGWAEFWTRDRGWQPSPTTEPAAAVTFLPTVIVAGALCASKYAPGATFRFPATWMTASGTTSQDPATVMLE